MFPLQPSIQPRLSVLLHQLHKAEQSLKRTAALLYFGSALTLATAWFLLAIEPKATVAALLAILLAVFAQRAARRSRMALIISALLHGLIAGLLFERAPAIPLIPLSASGAAAAVHGLLCLIALDGLRRISRLIAAELAAARPVPMDEVQMPGPVAARIAPSILPMPATRHVETILIKPELATRIPETPAPALESAPGPEPLAEPAVIAEPVTAVEPPVASAPVIEPEPRPERKPERKPETGPPPIAEVASQVPAPFVPLPQPPPPPWLPKVKKIDTLGRVQCPRCNFRQADAPFCVYCNLDLDRHWLAVEGPAELSSSERFLSKPSG